MNFASIRFRLTAWYAGLLALLLLIFSAATYIGLKQYLNLTLKESLSRRAKEIQPLLSGIAVDEANEVAEIRSHYGPESENGFLRISRINGSVLYASGAPRDLSFDPARISLPNVPAAPLGDAPDRLESLVKGGNLLISTFNLSARDGSSFLIEVGAPDKHIREVLRELIFVFALALPLLLLVSIAGGYALTRRALKPIGEITSKAEGISSRNLGERLPTPRTGDELERLSCSLNRMIERLQRAFQYLNRFSADASHELRTPLTILRGELESITQQPGLPEGSRQRIISALEETERLTKITESLLAVSRLDAGESQIERKNFDLASLAGITADQMRLLAEDKNISLACDLAECLEVEGDEGRMKQVIVNVLDNAIKYTAEGGEIGVSAARVNGSAVIEIKDNGPGIAASSLPHIFDRFYRADKARTRKDGGVGLGLAIARSICKLHDGDIKVQSSVGQGSRFQISIPMTKNSELS